MKNLASAHRAFEVVVPYYGSNERREYARNAVLVHLDAALIPHRVVKAWDSSPGAARNAGALALDADIVVFNDADTIVSPEQIRSAVWQASQSPGLVYAYDLYLRLTRESSEAMMRGEQPHWPVPEREILNAPSMGCAAISLECFREVGGFDERYVGWGYEDVDFANRCAERWPLRRVPGPAFHLWHGERDPLTDAPDDADRLQVGLNHERLAMKSGEVPPVRLAHG